MLHQEIRPFIEAPAVSHLDEVDIREIAQELRRDPRTVRRVVRGEIVRGLAGAEIRRAISARLLTRNRTVHGEAHTP